MRDFNKDLFSMFNVNMSVLTHCLKDKFRAAGLVLFLKTLDKEKNRDFLTRDELLAIFNENDFSALRKAGYLQKLSGAGEEFVIIIEASDSYNPSKPPLNKSLHWKVLSKPQVDL